MKTARMQRALGQVRARNTPRAEATPLPPRKRSQMGKTCPRIAATAAATARAESGGAGGWAILTARKALPRSRKRVARARPLAPERATLVAPMLPLPVERMSSFLKMRTRTYPKGIEPRRYAAGMQMSQGFMVAHSSLAEWRRTNQQA